MPAKGEVHPGKETGAPQVEAWDLGLAFGEGRDDGQTGRGGSSPAQVSFWTFSVPPGERGPQSKQLGTSLISAKHLRNGWMDWHLPLPL